ncbi:MAG: response regulator [Pseudomonadota bacterium]
MSSRAGHSILLVDDNAEVARAAKIAFRMAGHSLEWVEGAQAAYSMLARRQFDAIILDLNFSPGKADGAEGLDCLDRILADDPGACVVVLTAHGGMRTAVSAMQAGARDFTVKPWSNADLIARIEAAIARGPIVSAKAPASVPSSMLEAMPKLLGESAPIVALRDVIRKVAPTAAGVAITGPEGSGRTLAAHVLHSLSAHAGEEPLRIDVRDEGQWQKLSTHTGSVILRHIDQIDEMAQERLHAALHNELRTVAIAESLTRIAPTLLPRIAVVEVAVPPLAARGNDVILLARHFLSAAAERYQKPEPRLNEAAVEAIENARWPDDVRGLAVAMERALLLANGDELGLEALTLTPSPDTTESSATGQSNDSRFDLERTEKALIEAALKEHGHNISHAASALGLSRAALYRRMERYGL